MFGFLEFIIALILMICIIVFFVKFFKKPAVIIVLLCYLFTGAAVFSAGLVITIPMPTEKIQIDIPEDYSVKLYSVRSDGRVYAFYNNDNGEICLKEIFNNDIGKNLDKAVEIRSGTALNVPIGEGRSLTFLGPGADKVRVIFGESITAGVVSEAASDKTEILFGNTNWLFDNFIKVLRLLLFVVFIAFFMAVPFLFVYKYKFEKYNKFFYKIYTFLIALFKSYKIETVLCLVSTVLSYFVFLYIDLNSLSAWSIETLDAILRGGYVHFRDLCTQDLWNAHHGALSGNFPTILNFLQYIWNIPILLIQYCFNLPYETTELAMLWSKLLFELFSFGVAMITYKIIVYISGSKKRGLYTFIFVIGSITTFLAIGYSGQNDIVDTFFVCMGLYMAIIKNKKASFVFMLLSVASNPQLCIIAALVIFFTSITLKETVLKMLAVFLITLKNVVSIFSNPTSETDSYISWFFNTTQIPAAYGKISVITVVIIFLCLLGFSLKSYEQKTNLNNMLYSLCVFSSFLLICSYERYYRLQLPVILIILCVMIIEDENRRRSSLMGLCLFEYCFSIAASPGTTTFLHLAMMPDYIVNIFETEAMPYMSLYDYFYMIEPGIAKYLPIIRGAAVASLIWILYVCYLCKKENTSLKIICSIPKRLISTLFVSSSLIVMGIMFFVGFSINYFTYEYSEKATGVITNTNSIQEYYRGKSADWIRVGIKTDTGGMSYSDALMLNMDLLEVETGDIIGSYSYKAKEIKNSAVHICNIDDIDIKSNKWYIIKFYFTGFSENEEPILKLYRTKDGSSKEEKHFALVKENNQTVKADYDFVGEVFTGKKI